MYNQRTNPKFQKMRELVQSGALVRERVAGCDGCYLARLHEAEAYTAERLLAMTQTEYRRMPDTEQIAARIEAQLGLTFADQQKETLRLACQHGQGGGNHRVGRVGPG